jgi:hypothetical protein
MSATVASGRIFADCEGICPARRRIYAIRDVREIDERLGDETFKNLGVLGASAWGDKNGGDYRSDKFIEMSSAEQGPAVVAGRIDAGEPRRGQALLSRDGSIDEVGESQRRRRGSDPLALFARYVPGTLTMYPVLGDPMMPMAVR